MRKLLFTLVMLLAGAFGFAAGTPAKAMTAGPVTGMSDIVKSGAATQNVHWQGFCWRHPYHWRCRERRYYRYNRWHDRPWWW
jgi:hypothetical protein